MAVNPPVGFHRELARIAQADVVRGIIRRDPTIDGRWLEGGASMDWFDATRVLIEQPELLHAVEREADEIVAAGVRHVIWAGMGGSVVAVQALLDAVPPAGPVTFHTLDSTDPTALNALLAEVGELADVLMIAVALGLNSEEPVSHVEWFAGLLAEAGLPVAEHIMVLALPGSALERSSHRWELPVRDVSLGGLSVPPGRMSAPTTRTFLLPLALRGQRDLAMLLRRAWAAHAIDRAGGAGALGRAPSSAPDGNTAGAAHPFVRIAAALSAAGRCGGVRLLLRLPPAWRTLGSYVEMLLEQSLGKLGRGVLVFHDQELEAPNLVTVDLTDAPELAATDPADRAVALITHILGWQLVTVLYGYLNELPILTEPAVEPYKRRARELRAEFASGQAWSDLPGPGPVLVDAAGNAHHDDLARLFAHTLTQHLASGGPSGYLDVTINGEPCRSSWLALTATARRLASELGVPVKVRRAPAHYHVSEQAEMDGPGPLVSLRVIARKVPPSARGCYTGDFLTSAAVATWEAMRGAGRPCLLLVTPGTPAECAAWAEALLTEARRETSEIGGAR